MGVSGSGKTSVGRALALATGGLFFDADDYHPQENIDRMRAGIPLTDHDRSAWLQILGQLLATHSEERLVVLACSALKKIYRDQLRDAVPHVEFLYLHGSPELLDFRMRQRSGHFMAATMLHSQLEVLEPPARAVTLEITSSIPDLVAEARRRLNL